MRAAESAPEFEPMGRGGVEDVGIRSLIVGCSY